jgi:hypothetical protein
VRVERLDVVLDTKAHGDSLWWSESLHATQETDSP